MAQLKNSYEFYEVGNVCLGCCVSKIFLLQTMASMIDINSLVRVVTLFVAMLASSASFSAQLGPRPFYLIEDMDPGELREELKQCSDGPFLRSDFSIGHRGAPLQFPEHTRESYVAAARMGAGILECDVTFTKDRELVCRHSQCDLHTTTNILEISELAAKCSVPFRPATFNADGCLLYTSPSPRDRQKSRMPSSA